MPQARITKRSVDALSCPPSKDREILWDEDLSGFGIAAYPSGRKVYVIQFRKGGRSRRSKIGEHGRLTPDEARSEAKKTLGAIETGFDPIEDRRAARSARQFQEVAADYLDQHVKAKKKRRTAEEYERLLRLHLSPSIGTRRIGDINQKELSRLHFSMRSKPRAANHALALFSAIWNWSATGKHDDINIADNPARSIERYSEKKCERFLTLDEITRLGAALLEAETIGLPWRIQEEKISSKRLAKEKNRRTKIDPFAAAAIRLLILTGARLREILDAQWSQVDYERGILFIADSKTGKKPIYLSASALTILTNIPRLKGNNFIIPGTKDNAPRADLKKPWASVKHAANLNDVRIHDLRHSFASFGVGASLGLPVIGKLLGHSQPQTTARYAHLDCDPVRRAVESISLTISAALDQANKPLGKKS